VTFPSRVASAAVWTVALANAVVVAALGAPGNPITRSIGSHTAPYRQLHIAHRWKLFAPSPVMNDVNVLVRARLSDGRLAEYDVTTALLNEIRANRARGVQRVFEGLSHAVERCGSLSSRCSRRGDRNDAAYLVIVRTAYAQTARMVEPDSVRSIEVALQRRALPRFMGESATVAFSPEPRFTAPIGPLDVAPLR
jgi:hypothetical protein